jgi:hypothetical protein
MPGSPTIAGRFIEDPTMYEALGFIHARGAGPILGLLVIVTVVSILIPCVLCRSDKGDAK